MKLLVKPIKLINNLLGPLGWIYVKLTCLVYSRAQETKDRDASLEGSLSFLMVLLLNLFVCMHYVFK